MQNGNLRADVNVSICLPGAYEKYRETGDFGHLGTRCEIKNMNSMRFIQASHRIRGAPPDRDRRGHGGEVTQETRLYDPDKNETRSMRSKEEAHDYRYFPDPDLLPLEIEQGWVDDIAASLPELPDAKKARFIGDYGVTEYDASVLTADVELANYFEESVGGGDGKKTANWVINEVLGRANKAEVSPREIAEPAVNAEILAMVAKDEISDQAGEGRAGNPHRHQGSPGQIVESRGMKQVTDTGEIEAAVDQIIADNPAQVEKAKQNPKLAGWFVGQVMKATGGKANPKAVNQIVSAKLGL